MISIIGTRSHPRSSSKIVSKRSSNNTNVKFEIGGAIPRPRACDFHWEISMIADDETQRGKGKKLQSMIDAARHRSTLLLSTNFDPRVMDGTLLILASCVTVSDESVEFNTYIVQTSCKKWTLS